MISASCASLHWEMLPGFSLARTDLSDTWLHLTRGPCVCKKEERGTFYKRECMVRGCGLGLRGFWTLSFLSGLCLPCEGSKGGVGRGLCFLMPGSSTEIPFFLLPVLCWVLLVFSALLARFVVAMLVVMLVVMVVSPHPVGPSGCREAKEDRDMATAGERWEA